MDELANQEVDQYLEENSKIVPLFEIDVIKMVTPICNEEGHKNRGGMEGARLGSHGPIAPCVGSVEREMEISQRKY